MAETLYTPAETVTALRRERDEAVAQNAADLADHVAEVKRIRARSEAEVERLKKELGEARACIAIVRERVAGILDTWMHPPGGQQVGVPDKSISPTTCRELLRNLGPEQGEYTYGEWIKLEESLSKALLDAETRGKRAAKFEVDATVLRSEVARLRAALEEITGSALTWEDADRIARAALEGKP